MNCTALPTYVCSWLNGNWNFLEEALFRNDEGDSPLNCIDRFVVQLYVSTDGITDQLAVEEILRWRGLMSSVSLRISQNSTLWQHRSALLWSKAGHCQVQYLVKCSDIRCCIFLIFSEVIFVSTKKKSNVFGHWFLKLCFFLKYLIKYEKKDRQFYA